MARARIILVALALLGLTGLCGGCDPVGGNESAVLLVIQGSDAFVAMGVQPQVIDVGVSGVGTNATGNYPAGGWPNSPDTHTVLLMADDMMGMNSRDIAVTVRACGDAACNNVLGQGSANITLVAGDQVNDVLINVD